MQQSSRFSHLRFVLFLHGQRWRSKCYLSWLLQFCRRNNEYMRRHESCLQQRLQSLPNQQLQQLQPSIRPPGFRCVPPRRCSSNFALIVCASRWIDRACPFMIEFVRLPTGKRASVSVELIVPKIKSKTKNKLRSSASFHFLSGIYLAFLFAMVQRTFCE